MSPLYHIIYTCQDMARLLSDAMDRSLPWHTRLRMHLHLRLCLLCRRYQQQLTLLRTVLRKRATTLDEDDRADAPTLSPEAKARIQRALDSSRT
ncbi:MAG: zf-HC2 domain-containing protein [Nitrospirota bacterium]|nr:zf-HC2 domain-containing protein [Nitrospirota bacterium]MDP2381684.1 zf-HC2 domain-containing protein [Nitrospirota bacterium]MDP3595605.1 zf-HC2 domain-containing protein [Nitrospirota bacterium]